MRLALLVLPLLLACHKTPTAPLAQVKPVTLSFATVNDFHGALYETAVRDNPENAMGGLPWLVSAFDHLRAEDPDLIVLDGGDLFQGSWPVNASFGAGSVAAYNLIGADAAAVGNHEFDYGPGDTDGGLRGALKAGAKDARFAWLAANVKNEDGSTWSPEGIEPWTIIERKGVKIGILGLSTQDTPQTTLTKNVADLQFVDVVETVRQVAPKIREAGADVVIAIGHLTGHCEPKGYAEPPDVCMPDGEIGRLLAELPTGTLDVIVSGHAHTLLAHRWENTFVLESRAKGHLINQLNLVVGPDGIDFDASSLEAPWLLVHDAVEPGCTGAEFPLEALDVGGVSLQPSTEALDLIRNLESTAGSLCDEVGCAKVALTRDRHAESGVGDFMADAMLAAFPNADIALPNSGGLRADMPAGPLLREHIQAVMPFENRLMRMEMTGEQLLLLMRIGSSGGHGILQIAGGAYQFDPNATGGTDLNNDGELESWETDRLCSVTVGGETVDPKRTYNVVTTDFLVGGGDHLGPAFAPAVMAEEGPLLRDAMNTYLEAQSSCLGESVPLPNPKAPRIALGPC